MFFSDLDRTLIYSKRFKLPTGDEVVPVEAKNGIVISYMTAPAFKALMELKEQDMFVPVTARKWDEIMRIGFIKAQAPEWMICEAGRSIYHRGRRYEAWDQIISDTMQNALPQVHELAYERFRTLMESIGYPAWSINEYMLMTKVEGWTEKLKKQVEQEKGWFHNHGCSLLIQERKVYLFPISITKANAVKYLINLLQLERSVSSGDADMDYEMFRETQSYIAPRHHTICEGVYSVTEQSGINAAEEIIAFARKQLCP